MDNYNSNNHLHRHINGNNVVILNNGQMMPQHRGSMNHQNRNMHPNLLNGQPNIGYPSQNIMGHQHSSRSGNIMMPPHQNVNQYHPNEMMPNLGKQRYNPNPNNPINPNVSDVPRFDASEFPALGGDANNETPKVQHLSHRPPPRDFAMQNEDFPALSASTPSSHLNDSSMEYNPTIRQGQRDMTRGGGFPNPANDQPRGFPNQIHNSRSNSTTSPQISGQSEPAQNSSQQHQHNQHSSHISRSGQALPPPHHSNAPPHASSHQHYHPSRTRQHGQQPAHGNGMPDSKSESRNPNSRQTSQNAATNRFGLTGLLSVIRMTDPDLNTLALGTDLTTLGLNLNSTDVLYASFAYPCMDTPTKRDPDYVLPYCYYMQPPALKTSHLSKFQLESLFYIFYNMPKDTLQVYAARELYIREWKYQKELKLWFTRQPVQDANAQDTNATPGYMYFDINTWERRYFKDTQIPNLKFMTQEELDTYIL